MRTTEYISEFALTMAEREMAKYQIFPLRLQAKGVSVLVNVHLVEGFVHIHFESEYKIWVKNITLHLGVSTFFFTGEATRGDVDDQGRAGQSLYVLSFVSENPKLCDDWFFLFDALPPRQPHAVLTLCAARRFGGEFPFVSRKKTPQQRRCDTDAMCPKRRGFYASLNRFTVQEVRRGRAGALQRAEKFTRRRSRRRPPRGRSWSWPSRGTCTGGWCPRCPCTPRRPSRSAQCLHAERMDGWRDR